MALIFENVTLLAYRHTPVILGAGIRYKVTKNFTITGKLLSLNNTDGIAPTWSKSNNLQTNANFDYQDIILDGVDFGKGKIIGIRFLEGNNVRQLDYEYQIESFETGDMSSLGSYYSALGVGDIASLHSLEETFTYEENEHNTKTYEHSISVAFGQNAVGSLDQIYQAKQLINGLMHSTALSTFLGHYTHNEALKRTYTETYNAIDKSCSVTERIQLPFGASEDAHYVVNLSYSVEMDENGIVRATETGDIQGITTPVNASASEGLAAYAGGGVFSRVSAVCGSYPFSSDAVLNNVVIEKGVSINKFDGKITYHQTYTNDPHYSNLAIWDYTVSGERAEDGTITVSETGTVKGHGRPRLERYPNAKQFYSSTVILGISGRVHTMYATMGGTHTANLIMSRSDLGSSEATGEISYTQSWSDSSFYHTSSPSIRRQEVEFTTVYPIDKVFLVNVPNFKQVMQRQSEISVPQYELQINLKGTRLTTMAQYLTVAKSIAHSYLSDGYVQSCNYTLSPFKHDFSMSITYPFGSNG